MSRLEYKTEIALPEKAYRAVGFFLACEVVKVDLDWGLFYRGTVYYLDNSNTKAVRISPRRFWGLADRTIEVTEGVGEHFIDKIERIIDRETKEQNTLGGMHG